MARMKTALGVALVALGLIDVGFGSEAMSLKLESPLPHQVVQRKGFAPLNAHEGRSGGADLGHADVVIRSNWPPDADSVPEARAVALEDAYGRGTEWTRIEGKAASGRLEGTVHVPAGGWYRLEVRCCVQDRVVAQGSVEPFGVGEVFVIAGQSYATNCNDERLRVADTRGRVVAFDPAKGTWGVAHDPQPAPDGSDAGSIWPSFGDTLLPLVRVPIGFANVAFGGTSSTQWMPDGKLHARLVETGTTLGRFRAVLWQQGESDVIAKASTDDYMGRVTKIRTAAAAAWKFDPPWLLAKSTLHPTVYNDPAGEDRIRRAIDELCRVPGFRPGPDTDILGGENRGKAGSRRHFTGVGQRRAATLWFAAVWQELNRPDVPRPATPDMR